MYATLLGKWGDSGEQQLATAIDGDAAQLFECGATNKFVISAKDLGQLKVCACPCPAIACSLRDERRRLRLVC